MVEFACASLARTDTMVVETTGDTSYHCGTRYIFYVDETSLNHQRSDLVSFHELLKAPTVGRVLFTGLQQ